MNGKRSFCRCGLVGIGALEDISGTYGVVGGNRCGVVDGNRWAGRYFE